MICSYCTIITMLKNATIFVLVVLGALHVCTCKDIDDDANAQALQLIAIMDKAYALFNESIANLTAKQNEYTIKGNKQIKEMTANVTSQINAEVSKQKKEAEKAGVDASACFADVSDGGKHSVANITRGAKSCLSKENYTVEDWVSELELLRHNVEETKYEFNSLYYECDEDYDNKWEAFFCKNDTLRIYTPEVAEFPEWEQTYLPNATSVAQNVVKDVTTCLDKETLSESKKVKNVIIQLEKCVQNKIKAN